MKNMTKKTKITVVSLLVAVLLAIGISFMWLQKPVVKEASTSTTTVTTTQQTTKKVADYVVSEEEKAYLKQRFEPLLKVNDATIAYIYAPGTQLDEPVVKSPDASNAYYLDYDFEKKWAPVFGTVFMEYENKSDFSDRLTWLFGHARGSQVADHRMFNDVNFYDKQAYLDEHPFVVIETLERKLYYQVAFSFILPEVTELYRVQFKDDADFEKQLQKASETALARNHDVPLNPKDKYVVLSTCREERTDIRLNLYLRQVPDNELNEFLAKNKDKLNYVATR